MSARAPVELTMANCEVAYGRDITILRDISCTARGGAITGIIGPNPSLTVQL